MFLKLIDAYFGSLHTTHTFKREGPRHHTDGKGTAFACDLRHDGSCACAGAAAHTRCDENHIRAFQHVIEFIRRFFSRFTPNLRITTCTQTTGEFVTEAYACAGFRQQQSLRVGIHSNEFNTLNTFVDHAVDGVRSAATHADHFNPGECFHWQLLIVLLIGRVHDYLHKTLVYDTCF